MQTPRMCVLPGWLAPLAPLVLAFACGGSKEGASDGKADAQTPAPTVDAKAPSDVKAEPDPAAAGSGEAGSGPGEAGSGEAGPPPGADASGGTTGADATGGSGGEDTAGDTTGGGVDPKALIKEIKNKRTKDARAQAAVAEAEAAGVEPAELAKALNARGEALHASPERAKTWFQLALEKDAKDPKPAWNLAKQAAVVGELDEAKKWLAVVKERKGKKLLKQIEFDPMWEILKDDPDVRALLR